MASTSVHLPEALVLALDELAARRGTSRNRVIAEACEDLVARDRGAWPDGFFDLDDDELAVVREAGREMEAAILSSRRERSTSPP